jgi:hypothetical protein
MPRCSPLWKGSLWGSWHRGGLRRAQSLLWLRQFSRWVAEGISPSSRARGRHDRCASEQVAICIAAAVTALTVLSSAALPLSNPGNDRCAPSCNVPDGANCPSPPCSFCRVGAHARGSGRRGVPHSPVTQKPLPLLRALRGMAGRGSGQGVGGWVSLFFSFVHLSSADSQGGSTSRLGPDAPNQAVSVLLSAPRWLVCGGGGSPTTRWHRCRPKTCFDSPCCLSRVLLKTHNPLPPPTPPPHFPLPHAADPHEPHSGQGSTWRNDSTRGARAKDPRARLTGHNSVLYRRNVQ